MITDCLRYTEEGLYTLHDTATKYQPLEAALAAGGEGSGDWKADVALKLEVSAA